MFSRAREGGRPGTQHPPPPLAAGAPPTHRGDEPVQRLPSLCVLDRDGAEVIAEPDGRDDAAGVAVGDVLLGRRKRETWGRG